MRQSAAVILLLSALATASSRPAQQQDEGRSLSAWSGWAPAGSGMTMFASSHGDEDPWALQPPPVWKMGEDGTPRPLERGPPRPPAKKGYKKKHHREQEEEDEDDYSDERGSSRANASFNAWFPILLGYPGSRGDYDEPTARGKQPASSQPSRPTGEGGEGMAAIANSVNHGKSGVANSHAIVYAGEPDFTEPTGRRRASYRYYR